MIRSLRRAHRIWALILLFGALAAWVASALVRPGAATPAPLP